MTFFRQLMIGVGVFVLLATGSLVMGEEMKQTSTPTKQTQPVVETPASDATSPQNNDSLKEEVIEQKSENSPTILAHIVVTATAPASQQETAPLSEKYQLPQTTQSVNSSKIRETVNIVDTQDAVKYFPSLMVRKRNNGDTQSTLATRTWGVNSSARSLIYADDILLSALIGNNNTAASPKWNLVSPEEIDRIDFLYGPFAAAYPGNSMGGVLLITTRMPDKFVADINQTETFQTFSLYGTNDTYRTDQTSVVLGNKNGDVSWLITDNFQNSYSQPLSFITNGLMPANTTGTYLAQNKLGAAANVVGAGGLLHSQMNNTSAKVAWDITPEVKATYQGVFWMNDTDSNVQTYLRNIAGNPTFGSVNGFANNNYTLDQKHLANSISLKTDTKDTFDWDISLSSYYYLEDIQRSPYGVIAGGTSFTKNGNIARLDGTNWLNGDIKGIYRPNGVDGDHEMSFGFHTDRYYFENPTCGTPTWNGGPDSTSTLYAKGRGTTMTEALWAQDAWRFVPDFKFTFGGRLEFWQAFDGFNLSTTKNGSGAITSTTAQRQPEINDTRFSPKISLSWTPSSEWEVTSSFGQAYRFPTVTELYQIVATGPTFSIPNPNLKPENVVAEEISIQRKFPDGKIRLSFFNENVFDALISQTGLLSGQTPFTFVTNVDSIRNTGVELAAQKDNILFHGITLFSSVTYVDSEILSNPSFVSVTGTSSKGKRAPYVPDWRTTFGITYHPDDHWALTAAGRYSGKQYSTLDNTDIVSHVQGAFDEFFVLDLRAQYRVNDIILVDAGIDNVTDNRYFLFHPFPARTYSAQVKVLF